MLLLSAPVRCIWIDVFVVVMLRLLCMVRLQMNTVMSREVYLRGLESAAFMGPSLFVYSWGFNHVIWIILFSLQQWMEFSAKHLRAGVNATASGYLGVWVQVFVFAH